MRVRAVRGLGVRRPQPVAWWAATACAALCFLGSVPVAHACASCACGDPTVTEMGTEMPFGGRVGLGLRGQGRTDAYGLDARRVQLREARLALAASYAPNWWLTGYLTLPLVAREVTTSSLAVDRSLGPGDVEGRLRLVLWRDRPFAPGHLLGGWVGLRAPTGPSLRDDGRLLEHEAQPGSDAWVPLGGLWYAHFAYPWLLYGSVGYEVPVAGRGRAEQGSQVLATLLAQRHLGRRWALRGLLEWRWTDDGPAAREMGMRTGGWVLFVTPGFAWAFSEGGSARLALRVPLVDDLAPGHDEGLTLMGDVLFSWDLGAAS